MLSGVEVHPAKQESVAIRAGRWEFLDAVRGIAALTVLVQHGLERWTTWFRQWSASYLSLGTAGVVAFFLVSGFIIPVSIERYGSLKRFWLGRLFRLGPMYYTSFLVYMLLASALPRAGLMPLWNGHLFRFLLGNLTMMQEPFRVGWALGNYWTLTYELFFYVACSLLFALGVLRNSRLWAWLSVGGFLAVNVVSAVAMHRTLSAGRLGLIVIAFYGTLLYRYLAGKERLANVVALALALVVAFGITFWLHYSVYPVDTGEGYTRSSLGSDISWLAGAMVFATFFLLRRMEFPRPLLWLGRISYSLYLVHDIFTALLPTRLPLWLGMLLLVVLSLGVSELTYRFIERPMLSLQHRLFPHPPVTT